MDAKALTVREILYAGNQYLIPFFQRSYSWRKKHWTRLWNDLCALLEDKKEGQHFLGPLVCTSIRRPFGDVPAYQLIDGQQRMTTLTVLLAAIRDVAREHGLDDLAEEIQENYLIHKRKNDLQRYKIVPRIGDREALIGIIEGHIAKEHRTLKILQAWEFYRENVTDWAGQDVERKLNSLFTGVYGQLSLVVITIDQENPYEIFESLNSTGLPLEESDLIRNYMFMQIPTNDQEAFHTIHWDPFETMFDKSGDVLAIPLTPFFRNYLMRHGEYSRPKSTFVGFKEKNRDSGLSPADQLAELKRFAKYELFLRRPENCESPELRRAIEQIADLEITTAHPLLISLLDRYERGELAESDLLGCFADLSSFVLRRSICGESSRSYGRWFPEAIKSLQENPRDDLCNYWLRRGWPDDRAFTGRLQEFSIYRREPKKCRLILEALERSYGHKEKVALSSLTIEHVMPQAIKSGESAANWKAMLGSQWAKVHDTWLHTLGNLTLTGYNPELSNRSYDTKRTEFAKSNLVLNKHIATRMVWDGDAIKTRGVELAAEVSRLWPRPERGPGYELPVVAATEPPTNEARREHRKQYWTGFVDFLRENDSFEIFPKVSANDWLFFPMGSNFFRLITLIDRWNRYIGVAIICRGNHARTNFESLRRERTAIETEIGETLLWREIPGGKTFRISLRLPEVNTQDMAAWPHQYQWFADTVKTFYEVFSTRVEASARSGIDFETRQSIRKRFWVTLLERAAHRTNLHSGISPSAESWIGTGAGISGLGYNYVIHKQEFRVELYIDRGKGCKTENKEIFDIFAARRLEIETAFDGALAWERLDTKRASRIAYRLSNGGYRSPEETWPEIQDAMIDAMIRLEKALMTHIDGLKKKT